MEYILSEDSLWTELITRPGLRSLGLGRPLVDTALPPLLTGINNAPLFPDLQELECFVATAEGAQALFPHIANLTQLEMRVQGTGTGTGLLGAIARSCPKLTSIKIVWDDTSSTNIPAEELMELANALGPKLSTLSLIVVSDGGLRSDSLTDAHMCEIVSVLNPDIKVLELEVGYTPEVGDATLRAVLQRCTRLEDLEIGDTYNLMELAGDDTAQFPGLTSLMLGTFAPERWRGTGRWRWKGFQRRYNTALLHLINLNTHDSGRFSSDVYKAWKKDLNTDLRGKKVVVFSVGRV